MVIRRNLQPQPGPGGTLVFWLFAVVVGIGVSVVLLYHFVLSSHNGQATELAKVKLPTTTLQTSIDATDDMRAAQASLLKGQPTAVTPAAGTVATSASARSGPETSASK